MELIAKVTSKCDMACTFCSAAKLSLDDMTPEEVAEAVDKTGAQSLILLGGEALCLGVNYYYKLLDITKDINLDFTTNLKAFRVYPDEWTPLFRNSRVNICTSFNYGSTRLYDKNTIYTEDMFKETMLLFKDRVGYVPPFIAVLDESNVNTWRKHIALAKELGTRCRLNNALKYGRQGKYFPRSELFKIWIKIVKEGLDKYEINADERKRGVCPLNTSGLCKSTIRVVQKRNGKLIYHACDDHSNATDPPLDEDEIFSKPVIEHCKIPLRYNCYACRLYDVCNGCDTNREMIEDIDGYCNTMKSLEKDLIDQGWVR